MLSGPCRWWVRPMGHSRGHDQGQSSPVSKVKDKITQLRSSNQENQGWVSDESDGCGQLAFVSSAVRSGRLVRVLRELELLQGPLHHLRGETEGDREEKWNEMRRA